MSIIVSLTSTSRRMHMCRATILSLVSQELIPDKIVLNLSKEPYLKDDGVYETDILNYLTESIPLDLKNIIDLRWVRNTGPYRKLLPTLQQASEEDIIITADDDIFYDRQWLKLLLDNFDFNNKVIHAGRVRKIKKNNFNKLSGYTHWPIIKNEQVLKEDWIITYGGGAVLYKGWFSESLLEDTGFLSLAPTADDLWYSKICKLCNLKVKVVPDVLDQLNFFIHNEGLVNENLPSITTTISKIKYYLIDSPLSYYGLRKFGNDVAYDAIDKYFQDKKI